MRMEDVPGHPAEAEAEQGGRREEEQPPESPSTAASPADNAAAAPEPATAAEQPNETGAKEVQETESDSDAESENELDLLTAMKRLGLSVPDETTPLPPPRPPVLTSFDLAGVAEKIKSGAVKNMLVMVGAGISVSAGIPDFRTPGTGLYDNLAKYDLPSPQHVFEINYFRQSPKAFYALAAELHPAIARFNPTPTHHFLKLLSDKGVLRRCWSQNIDSLESKAGLPADKLVAAHGNFDGATCIATGEKVPAEEMCAAIEAGEVGWKALRDKYGGLVKPDIVFFGEDLPERFHRLVEPDFSECDLLLVMGTSLAVNPFASLVAHVPSQCPRVLVNREKVGEAPANPHYEMMVRMGLASGDHGFVFQGERQYRDVFVGGDCDAGCLELAALLGWEEELQALIDAAAASD